MRLKVNIAIYDDKLRHIDRGVMTCTQWKQGISRGNSIELIVFVLHNNIKSKIVIKLDTKDKNRSLSFYEACLK